MVFNAMTLKAFIKPLVDEITFNLKKRICQKVVTASAWRRNSIFLHVTNSMEILVILKPEHVCLTAKQAGKKQNI